VHDFRARANRKCYQFTGQPLRRAACFDKYIKQYEVELHKNILAQVQGDMKQRVMAIMQLEIPTLQQRNLQGHLREDSTASVSDATPTEGEDSEDSDDNEWEIGGRRALFRGNKKLTAAIRKPAASLVSDDDERPAAKAKAVAKIAKKNKKLPHSGLTSAGAHFAKYTSIKAHAQKEQDEENEEFVQTGYAFDQQ